MAKFYGDEIDNYGSSSGNYFSLKKNREKAKVRFLYSSPEDIQGFSVHTVKVGDKDRYVNCIREYTDPIDVCPFCAAGKKVQAKLFIPLYNEEAQQVQLWERGKKFYYTLSELASRTPNLVSQVFEVTRLGEAGSTDTTYNLYPIGQPDDAVVEDFEEAPDPLGRNVLDKTAEEMEEYLDFGSFPSEDEDAPQQEMPMRRSASPAPSRRQAASAPAKQSTRQSNAGRRTPSARGRRASQAEDTEDEELF